MLRFDTAMRSRFQAEQDHGRKESAAVRVVRSLVAGGRKMPDAIADAVESMPWNETEDLRRWVDTWEAWSKWTDLAAMGWKIDRVHPTRVIVRLAGNGPLIKTLGRYVSFPTREELAYKSSAGSQRWDGALRDMKALARSSSVREAVAAGADIEARERMKLVFKGAYLGNEDMDRQSPYRRETALELVYARR